MEVQELRIGNLIYSKELDINNGCEILLTKEFYYYILQELLRGNTLKKYSPIQLTEELAIKFGAIKNNDWYDIGIFGLNFIEKRMVSNAGNYYNQYKLPEYVHQLQNLCFALTGEELKMI